MEEDEKITWSSDDNKPLAPAGGKQLSRKKKPRKEVTSGTAGSKARATDSRKSRRRITSRKTSQQPQPLDEASEDNELVDEEDEDELPEEALPHYVKLRRVAFELARNELGRGGLKLPPSYDGVDFSEDERPSKLARRPVFPASIPIVPIAPFKDVPLDRSGGAIPAPIAQWLRDYQIDGARFLHERFAYQRGAILGDAMGLGKTIQVISFLTAAFGKTGDERDDKRMRKMRRLHPNQWYPRVLIICPGSLMSNWLSELGRWGWWHAERYHGAASHRRAVLEGAASGHVEVMITTYTTYKLNMQAINTVEWDCVVADECHFIKERRSDITRAMNDINALCRIGLTGTPMQNNYEDLWTLFNWANPGKLGTLSAWKKCISDPLRIGQAHGWVFAEFTFDVLVQWLIVDSASVAELSRARRTAYKVVHNLMPQFLLYRPKSIIADQLPSKSDRVVYCPLTATQSKAYKNLANSDVFKKLRGSQDPCQCGSGSKSGSCCSKVSGLEDYIFPCIVAAQKLANHLALLIPSGESPMEKQEKELEWLKLALPDEWEQLYRSKDNILNLANLEFCGKFNVLRRLLAFWFDNGDKALVFSRSVRLLKMLHMLFTSSTSYSVSFLDGAMTYDERAKVVDDFNTNPNQFVFLISIGAGGVGLNITSANKVVIVDPHWNPSHDLQAQDRAYRIGQVRDVEVFRLVSAGTIEEVIYARQVYKQQMANIAFNASHERRYFDGVQDRKEQKGEIFGLKNLLAYGEDLKLREIFNRTNIAESKMGIMIAELDTQDQEEQVLSDDEVSAHGQDEEQVDSAMRKIVAQVTSDLTRKRQRTKEGSKKRTNGEVEWILTQAGIKYSHENSEVIGSSKIESELSRQAMERSNGVGSDKETVFASGSKGAPEGEAAKPSQRSMYVGAGFTNRSGTVQFKFGPARDVCKRQFCTMASHFGFGNAIQFAMEVESWTPEQRRNRLDGFYKARRRALLRSAEG